MPHRLPMHADRAYLGGGHVAAAQQLVTAHGISRGERVGGERLAFDLVFARLLQREQRLAQARRETDERLGQHHGRLPVGEPDGHAVHAVHARA
ncbi:conserved hypothetical protein [Paraburkholderia graminis C4D1M]|uniref:Uncharacterized protein n=1 Tax=Paraburkholderia graminis (strain ATCC 700544 / DSM 17151 / LMG 18924 / NCIMB 13744 / C4D1M) TaxID=396598 RepID=B1G1Y7_PARG4|nr:conserved hypothetical protein [Paraburkholderia graminis C4D1M]